MKEIPLTQGKVALVDDEDYEYINQWKWHLNSHGYAIRSTTRYINPRKVIFMHRAILNNPIGTITDHINHNPIDNRRCNLRICTPSQNQANKGKYKNNTSGFKGVGWHKRAGKWNAKIKYQGRFIHIGLFENIQDAANAYNQKAKELFGEFANG